MSAILQSRAARFTGPPAWDGQSPASQPGELLTMDDGTQWFHPYSGAAPVQVTHVNRSGLWV